MANVRTCIISRGQEKAAATMTDTADTATLATLLGTAGLAVVVDQAKITNRRDFVEHLRRAAMKIEEGQWPTGT